MSQAGTPQLRWISLTVKTLLVLIGLGVGWMSVASDGPVIPKGKGEQCVADTDFMRRNHMNLLLHQRDETVLSGIRDKPFSLAECVDCHVQTATNGEPIRIDAREQFCESCHSYAAVKMDCFGCHAAVPDSAASVTPVPDTSGEKQDTLLNIHLYLQPHNDDESADD